MDIVFVMDCQDAARREACLNFNTWTKKNQGHRKRREKKGRWGARMKEKKNHFLTSVYSHSVPELRSSDQP